MLLYCQQHIIIPHPEPLIHTFYQTPFLQATPDELIYMPRSTCRDRPLHPEARPKGAAVSFHTTTWSEHTSHLPIYTIVIVTLNQNYSSTSFISCTSNSRSTMPRSTHAPFFILTASSKISSFQNI